MIDFEAYLRRIVHFGDRTPTLATLRSLHARHTEAIAFENLNPFLRWPVLLDPASLEQKLIREGRGGYCFEQNLLFGHALRSLGFRVTGLAARVLWNQPEDAVTARSHMLLLVDLDGEFYIADVGFGGQTPTSPLRLDTENVQVTQHESFRIATAGTGFKMQTSIGQKWKTLYRFDLEEQFQIDYEIANYYLSTNPASYFVNNLIAARPAADRRYALFNNQFTVHHLSGSAEQRSLSSVPEMRAVLEDAFRLRLPTSVELDAALARCLGVVPRLRGIDSHPTGEFEIGSGAGERRPSNQLRRDEINAQRKGARPSDGDE